MPAINHGDQTAPGATDPNELVRRALNGCADAFTELSLQFRPRLICLLEHRYTCRTDAEDIAQEALARAFQKLDRFNPQYRFSTWLFTIAIRMARDHARSERHRARYLPLSEVPNAAADDDVAESLQQRDEVNNIWTVAKQVLSDPQYTAMWLRYGEDMSVNEIATIMHKSRVGVRVILHRARSVLISNLQSS